MSEPPHNFELAKAVVLDDLPKVKELVTFHGLPSAGYEIILDAVKLGRGEIVQFLLEKVKVDSAKSEEDHTLANGDPESVQMQLANSVTVNAAEGQTLLLSAAEFGHTEIATYLLKKGVSQSKFTEPRSLFDALCIASQNGCEEIVSLLISASADCEIFDSYGSYDNFPLHLACKGGHLGVVKLLLEYKEQYINFVELKSGFTPLHTACENGHMEVILYLLTRHADLSIAAANGLTPLDSAAKTEVLLLGNLKIVDLLCKNGANVNAWDGRSMALVMATERNHTDVAKILLCRGASVNGYNDEHSLLRSCLKNKNHSLCSFILQFKPVIDKKFVVKLLNLYNDGGYNPVVEDLIVYSITNKQCHVGRVPLATAIIEGYQKTVRTLVSHGVSPEDGTFETENTNCVSQNTHFHRQDGKLMNRPLHLAVQKQRYEIIQILLEAGCDVNAVDVGGNTPLYYLFDCYKRFTRFDIFQLLVANGADLTKVPYLLHKAVKSNDLQVCQYLVENYNADVNAQDELGVTPLFYTALSKLNGKRRATPVIEFLVNRGANVTLRDRNGNTALHQAAKYQNSELLLILLENGADVNAKNEYGETPLHIAVLNECVDAVGLLLKSKAKIDCKDNEGRTPVHCAVLSLESEIIGLLLDHDCDVNIRDDRGKIVLGILDELTENHPILIQMCTLEATKMLLIEQVERLIREHSIFDEAQSHAKRQKKE